MNSRERVHTALTCKTPDRIPTALGFFPQQIPGVTFPDEYFNLDIRYAEFPPLRRQTSFRNYLSNLPADVHVGSRAQLKTYHDWQYHPERKKGAHGIPGKRELRDFLGNFTRQKIRELASSSRYDKVKKQIEGWHEKGKAVAAGPPHLGGDLFEAAWRMRGFETFLLDMAMNRPFADDILDRLTAMVTESVATLARAGVDIILLDDDVAMPTQLLLSPAMWRKYYKPRFAKIINVAREVSPDVLIFFHSDGNFTAIIPDLVDIGVNVINPVQPDCMNAEEIKRSFGDRLALWGTVGTAMTWDRGTPAQIRDEVKQRIKRLGPSGLLLAPAYDIDYSPNENLEAFTDTVREFGKTS